MDHSSDPRETVSRLVTSIVQELAPKRILKIESNEFSLFGTIEVASDRINWRERRDASVGQEQFDLILAELPFNMRPIAIDLNDRQIRVKSNWNELINLLQMLGTNGTCITNCEPSLYSTKEGKQFQELLKRSGFSISATFYCPEGILRHYTSLVPLLLLINRGENSRTFFGELVSPEQSVHLAIRYRNGVGSDSLFLGKFMEPKDFTSFPKSKILEQIEMLDTQYKEFDAIPLKDLVSQINYVKSGQSFEDVPNSVYVPKIGTSGARATLSELTLKQHNYFQLVLNDKCNNDYLATYFKSRLGKLTLQSLFSGTFISHLNRKELGEAIVALPPLIEQDKIAKTQKKIRQLTSAIGDFESEVAVNPTKSEDIQTKLDGMLELVGRLARSDKVFSLIQNGESKTVELKETLSWDVRQQTKAKHIETSALKTIVAFLNSDGGSLIVGVRDDGTVTGIEVEVQTLHKGIQDRFLLNLKNMLKERIGEEFYPFINSDVVNLGKKQILLVDCKVSPSPCFLDSNEFYVRTNPATDKLEGPKLVEYVKHHFGHL